MKTNFHLKIDKNSIKLPLKSGQKAKRVWFKGDREMSNQQTTVITMPSKLMIELYAC